MADKNIPKQAINEFGTKLKPVSLWADAWKRLRRNKMALVGLWVFVFYIIVSLSAPLLENIGVLFSYTEQVTLHQDLPPSFQSAGVLTLKRMDERMKALEEAIAGDSGGDSSSTVFSTGTGFDFGTPAADSSPAAGSTPEAAEDDDFNPYGDETGSQAATTEAAEPVAEAAAAHRLQPELDMIRADRENLVKDIAINPVHKRVHILGTDVLGRDMLARVIWGGRISILIGIVGTITAAFIGIIIGAIAGYMGGAVDNVLMRFVDIMYGLPYMLIVIIIMSIVGDAFRGNFVIMFVAIALVSWLTIARVVRGQIISLKNSEFVEAARSMGASTTRIIFRHLVPNTLGVIIVFMTLLMPGFIMSESFLSFLGLGVSAPDASWGTLVSEGVAAMEVRPWMLLVPGIAMTLFLFFMNFLGDGLRDALDPQSKNRA